MQTNPSPIQLQAAELKARILSGEKIPREELISFILASNQTLQKQRKSDEKPTDVEFF